jgi:hypothetical protein
MSAAIKIPMSAAIKIPMSAAVNPVNAAVKR